MAATPPNPDRLAAVPSAADPAPPSAPSPTPMAINEIATAGGAVAVGGSVTDNRRIDLHYPTLSDAQQYRNRERMLARVRNPDAVIFTDVFGATPCNVAQRLADGTQVKVIAGVNVPMLWRSLCYAAEGLDAVVARAMAGATQGVMQVATSRPQTQSTKPGGHDQVNRQNQQ